jgi:hypothetical protein
MAWAAAVVALVGALVQGRQQANELRQQGEIEGYKAKVAAQNAQVAGQQASAEQERLRRESRQVLGAQRAAIAESGTGFSGSNLDIMRQSTTMAELDALNIQYAGEMERRGLLQESTMFQYNKDMLRQKARSVMRQRWIAAIGAAASAYGGGMGGGAAAGAGGGG